jgi:hypothetical protein
MMNGGQPIDPGLIQALKGISSGQEDQQNLEHQMALAHQLRTPMPANNQMAGKVVIRQSPFAYLNAGLRNAMSSQKENDALQGMQAQATKLRDVRGKFMDELTAHQNPDQVHPDSLAQLDPTGGQMDPDIPNMAQMGAQQ